MLALTIIGFQPAASSATNQDQPTIAKDSIQITAFTFNVYKGNYAFRRAWLENARLPRGVLGAW
jgi:hypothetical protein